MEKQKNNIVFLRRQRKHYETALLNNDTKAPNFFMKLHCLLRDVKSQPT